VFILTEQYSDRGKPIRRLGIYHRFLVVF
jgi:hypothetical protein